MRRSISRDEAERILVNGGEVWRGKFRYCVNIHDPWSFDKPTQSCDGSNVTIKWSEFNSMGNFEVVEE